MMKTELNFISSAFSNCLALFDTPAFLTLREVGREGRGRSGGGQWPELFTTLRLFGTHQSHINILYHHMSYLSKQTYYGFMNQKYVLCASCHNHIRQTHIFGKCCNATKSLCSGEVGFHLKKCLALRSGRQFGVDRQKEFFKFQECLQPRSGRRSCHRGKLRLLRMLEAAAISHLKEGVTKVEFEARRRCKR